MWLAVLIAHVLRDITEPHQEIVNYVKKILIVLAHVKQSVEPAQPILCLRLEALNYKIANVT